MIDRKHIDKVFVSRFSLLDQRMLEEYFKDQKLNDETRLIIKKQWDEFEVDLAHQPNLEHVFYKLHYSITQKKSTRKSYNLLKQLSRIAAVLVIGMLFIAVIYFSQKSSHEIFPQQVEFISYGGFRNQFILPDGTIGWLGYNSKLKYHVNKKGQRIANLDGLAYFNVAPKNDQAFIVETPQKLGIKVLGTRFNVSSYAENDFCEIVLEQGKINLLLLDRTIEKMHPNERIIYNSQNYTLKKSNVETADYVAWKDGKLLLNDNSLEEACQKIGKFYNVEFEIQTKGMEFQEIRLILEDETLDDALKLLAMIVPVRYQIIARKVLDNNTYSKKKIIIRNR